MSRVESQVRDETRPLLLTSEVRVTGLDTTSDARASAHPASCRACRGSGWVAGPPIPVRQHGELFETSTVVPCEHKWWWDDPSPDEPIGLGEYVRRLSERAARGDQSARAELSVWQRPSLAVLERPSLTVDG